MEDIVKLSRKYSLADTDEHMLSVIRKDWKALCIFELAIEHISGKEGKELLAERHPQ